MTTMQDPLINLVRDMDQCWLERRYADLRRYLADDVVMVAPEAQHRISGSAAAIETYRDFMERSRVDMFAPVDYRVTRTAETAVVEYAWRMAWETEGEPFDAEGREVLVLAERDKGWQVIWRMQLAT